MNPRGKYDVRMDDQPGHSALDRFQARSYPREKCCVNRLTKLTIASFLCCADMMVLSQTWAVEERLRQMIRRRFDIWIPGALKKVNFLRKG